MEVSNKFACEFNGEGITVKQTMDKKMEFMESLSELEKLRTEKIQIENQIKQLQEAVDTGKLNTDLEQAKKNLAQVDTLEKEWEAAIEPKKEELINKMKLKISAEKKKLRYDPKQSMADKLQKMSQILGPVANEFSLDMRNKIVSDLRTEFDNI